MAVNVCGSKADIAVNQNSAVLQRPDGASSWAMNGQAISREADKADTPPGSSRARARVGSLRLLRFEVFPRVRARRLATFGTFRAPQLHDAIAALGSH